MRNLTCCSCGSEEFKIVPIYNLQIPSKQTQIDPKTLTKIKLRDLFICGQCSCSVEEGSLNKPLIRFIIVKKYLGKIKFAKEFSDKLGKDVFFIFSNAKEKRLFQAVGIWDRIQSKHLLKDIDIKEKNIFTTDFIFFKVKNYPMEQNYFVCLTDNEFDKLDRVETINKLSVFFVIIFPDQGGITENNYILPR